MQISRLYVVAFVFLTFFSACSLPENENLRVRNNEIPQPPKTELELPLNDVVRAPWEITTQDSGFEEIDIKISQKRSGEALELLRSRKQIEDSPGVIKREASLLLKLGRADEVLGVISEFASRNHLSMEELPPELSLITAFAYKKNKDIDQTFAWLGVTLRKAGSIETFRAAKLEVKNLLSRISESVFPNYVKKWERDFSLSPLILEEQRRRAGGGEIVRLEQPDFFSPATYGYSDSDVSHTATKSDSELPPELIILVSSKPKLKAKVEDLKNAVKLALTPVDTGLENPPKKIRYSFLTEEQIASADLSQVKVIIDSGQHSKFLADQIVPKKLVLLNLKGAAHGVSGTELDPSDADEIAELERIASESLNCSRTFKALRAESDPISTSLELQKIQSLVKSDSDADISCLIGSFDLENEIGTLSDLKKSAPKLKLLGPSSWVDPVLLHTYAQIFEGSTLITPFYPGSTRSAVRKFISGFQNSYGTEPSYADALAYDAAKIAEALILKKMLESKAESYDLQSVTGIEKISLRPSSNTGPRVKILGRRFTRLMLKEGELEEQGAY